MLKGKAKKIGKFTFIQYGPKNMKGNYYTKGKPYSDGAIGKGINKVSKITKKNCPKLSSKYWTYSKAKGRMILKNNKEK